MQGTLKKIFILAKKSLILAVAFAFIVGIQVYANSSSTYNQTINAGSQSVDIVDSGGTPVTSPAVTFGAKSFSFSTQDATGTFGTSDERIRAYNPTVDDTWTVNLAGSATTATWTASSLHYDFNDDQGYTDGTDTDSYGGQMTVDPSGGTLAGVSGCSTSNVSKGTSDDYEEGAVDSIDLMSAAAGAATFCRWDLTAVGLTQKVPASQAAGSYSLTMVISIQ
jgi:hypothetical protein